MDAHSDRLTQLVYCPSSAGEIGGVIEQAERVLAHRASTQRVARTQAHPISLSLHRDCGSQCSQWTTQWHLGDDLSFGTKLRGNIIVCPVSCLLAHELRQELTTQLSTAVVVDGMDQICKSDSLFDRDTLQRASSGLETLSSHIATVPHTQPQPRLLMGLSCRSVWQTTKHFRSASARLYCNKFSSRICFRAPHSIHRPQ